MKRNLNVLREHLRERERMREGGEREDERGRERENLRDLNNVLITNFMQFPYIYYSSTTKMESVYASETSYDFQRI
jgi:hypothetical protein